MMIKLKRFGWLSLVCLSVLAACTAPVEPLLVARSASQPTAGAPGPAGSLNVSILYPTAGHELTPGQSTRLIARVTDTQGAPVTTADVTMTLRDPEGKVVQALPARPYGEDAFRSDAVSIPHRSATGTWRLDVEASQGSAAGAASGTFQVKPSPREELLAKYGFWHDPPSLRGISLQLFEERGDARNGMVRWGGFVPSMHVQASAWIDVQWRTGDFGLDSAEAVRRFLLDRIGDLSFTRVREIGAAEPVRFKQWDAWLVTGRGRTKDDQVEWLVFYAPEVDKTYVLGTTVVFPPVGMDAHAALRESFDTAPEVRAEGVAPEPLLDLLPRPELLEPPVAASYQGADQEIVLRWQPLKELAEDEYYEVAVEYDHRENNYTVRFPTRETELALPGTLYTTPNCRIFNWQVTLMRQTGEDPAGNPTGEALSYPSLYWYVWWLPKPGEDQGFDVTCPYAHVD